MQLSIILPSNFSIELTPEQIVALPYRFIKVATNKTTKEQHWLIEAETQAKLNEFDSLTVGYVADKRANHDYRDGVASWNQNSYPNITDTTLNPVQKFELGREKLKERDNVNDDVSEGKLR